MGAGVPAPLKKRHAGDVAVRVGPELHAELDRAAIGRCRGHRRRRGEHLHGHDRELVVVNDHVTGPGSGSPPCHRPLTVAV